MKLTLTSIRFSLAVATSLMASTMPSYAVDPTATATISDVPVAGSFDYTITLHNTSATASLNGFWYGWTLSGNNLPSVPSSAGNLGGWNNLVDGNSIMWANSTGTAIGPGQSGTFTFVSTATPAAITAGASGESVAYEHGIDFSQGSAGDSTGIFSPTLVAVPEPSTTSLLAVGALGFYGTLRRKIRGQ